MQTLDYYVASTLDGYIAHDDGSFDGFLAEGPHVPDYLATLQAFDAVVMGRRTYEVGARVGVADPYPWLKTFVASRDLPDPGAPNVTIVRDGVADVVRELRARPGRGIYLCGGAELATTLLVEGLVDHISIKLNPVLFGAGIGLTRHLPRRIPLELMTCTPYDNGVVLLRYRVPR